MSSIVPSIDATADVSRTRPKRITASENMRPSAAQSVPGDWIEITWPERSSIVSPGAQPATCSTCRPPWPVIWKMKPARPPEDARRHTIRAPTRSTPSPSMRT